MTIPDDQDTNVQAVDTAAALFGVVLQPEWREGTVANFSTIAKAARLVMAFPLDDEAEYGPVFRP